MTEDLEELVDDYSGDDPAKSGLLSGLLPNSPPVSSPLALVVDAASAGLRLDVFLQAQFPETSRSRLQKWVGQGHVTVDEKSMKPAQTLREGQVVQVVMVEPEPTGDWVAEPMDLQIVYEDEHLLVVNKPAGLVVHPAVGHASGTLLNGLLAHCPALARVPRAGIVHRLDRDTTGLMVVAKTLEAQFSLVNQLQSHTVARVYLAMAWGTLAGQQQLETLMGRDPRDRQKMAVIPDPPPIASSAGMVDGDNRDNALEQTRKPNGKQAITHIRPLQTGQYLGFAVTLVECRLETGRTHQIRVHLQHLRHPLVGDTTYTRHAPHISRLQLPAGQQIFSRQALHAHQLEFIHPASLNLVRFSCPLPDDFLGLMAQSGISWLPQEGPPT
jgi:23S rRNA pseudouridine1911/1915/1917 synthase